MSSQMLIEAQVISLLAAIWALAVYSEIRSRRFGPAREQDRIFRCERCGSVYTDDADVERSRCAQCGNLNEAIDFERRRGAGPGFDKQRPHTSNRQFPLTLLTLWECGSDEIEKPASPMGLTKSPWCRGGRPSTPTRWTPVSRFRARTAATSLLKIPIIASAMDGVTDVRFCIEMGKLGGLGVINLEGIQTRYETRPKSWNRL